MTVEEYAKAVCIEEDRPEPQTWAEARKRIQDDLDHISGLLSFPEEVRGYHLATLAAMRAFLRATEEKPKGDPVNPYELALDSDYMTTMAYRDSEKSGLDEETRATLKSHGCLDEEEA